MALEGPLGPKIVRTPGIDLLSWDSSGANAMACCYHVQSEGLRVHPQ